MKKYICPIEYYPNCRVHDSGFYCSTEFFDTIEELLCWAKKFIEGHEIKSIYNTNGEEIGSIKYDLGSHTCIGITISIDNKQYTTSDDGKGNLIWHENDINTPEL